MHGAYDEQDRLTSYGTTTYVPAAGGEWATKTDGISGGVTQYTYDALGNLTHVALPGGPTIDYIVDGLGRRIGKKVNGVLTRGWLYRSRLQPVAELDGNGAVVSVFVYGLRLSTPEYMVKGGVTYRIITDHVGSPRLVVDAASGQVVQRLDYDEWGRVTLNNANFQPFGFAGGLYDPDTKLVRFGVRDYDAETARWTSKDPGLFTGGPNLYQYANGDPITYVDRDGRFPFLAALAVVAVPLVFGAIFEDEGRVAQMGSYVGADMAIVGAAFAVAPFAEAALVGLGSAASSRLQSCGGATVTDLLRPDGRLIGQAGTSSRIRILQGGQTEAEALFGQLSKDGQLVEGTSFPGTLIRLPGGGQVGFRLRSTSGPPTINVSVDGLGIREIKFLP